MTYHIDSLSLDAFLIGVWGHGYDVKAARAAILNGFDYLLPHYGQLATSGANDFVPPSPTQTFIPHTTTSSSATPAPKPSKSTSSKASYEPADFKSATKGKTPFKRSNGALDDGADSDDEISTSSSKRAKGNNREHDPNTVVSSPLIFDLLSKHVGTWFTRRQLAEQLLRDDPSAAAKLRAASGQDFSDEEVMTQISKRVGKKLTTKNKHLMSQTKQHGLVYEHKDDKHRLAPISEDNDDEMDDSNQADTSSNSGITLPALPSLKSPSSPAASMKSPTPKSSKASAAAAPRSPQLSSQIIETPHIEPSSEKKRTSKGNKLEADQPAASSSTGDEEASAVALGKRLFTFDRVFEILRERAGHFVTINNLMQEFRSRHSAEYEQYMNANRQKTPDDEGKVQEKYRNKLLEAWRGKRNKFEDFLSQRGYEMVTQNDRSADQAACVYIKGQEANVDTNTQVTGVRKSNKPAATPAAASNGTHNHADSDTEHDATVHHKEQTSAPTISKHPNSKSPFSQATLIPVLNDLSLNKQYTYRDIYQAFYQRYPAEVDSYKRENTEKSESDIRKLAVKALYGNKINGVNKVLSQFGKRCAVDDSKNVTLSEVDSDEDESKEDSSSAAQDEHKQEESEDEEVQHPSTKQKKK